MILSNRVNDESSNMKLDESLHPSFVRQFEKIPNFDLEIWRPSNKKKTKKKKKDGRRTDTCL
jgi:hypothetical protein